MNLMDEFGKLTSQVTDRVSDSAKKSAIATLNDPEFKAAVNQFTRDWFDEHQFILVALIGSMVALTAMATVNIITNFSRR